MPYKKFIVTWDPLLLYNLFHSNDVDLMHVASTHIVGSHFLNGNGAVELFGWWCLVCINITYTIFVYTYKCYTVYIYVPTPLGSRLSALSSSHAISYKIWNWRRVRRIASQSNQPNQHQTPRVLFVMLNRFSFTDYIERVFLDLFANSRIQCRMMLMEGTFSLRSLINTADNSGSDFSCTKYCWDCKY